MESVAPHLMLLRNLVGQGIGVRVIGKIAVEGCIKDCHHRHARPQRLAGCIDAIQGGRVVQGRKLAQVLDGLYHRVINKGWLDKPVAPMHHPVPDRLYPSRRDGR